uniref:Retrotransposon Copia-like N-terminal domain-containing protein n=1 Tax=Cajanus cajan TaxID=3821 RepID=A0A151R098_CAJCA|nr:hypothetical protein KK1_042880 [Cajanus cajan]
MANPNNLFYHLVNPTNPFFLDPRENPTLVLVTPLFIDNDYQQWKHNMIMALETKNKDQFVLGALACPPSTDPLHETWKGCNKMVMSWLTRSMTPSIKQSVIMMISCVIKFPRGLNDEFSQVRSQIMLMELMPNLVKTFSLVLQQQRAFNGSFSQNSQELIANVNFQDNSNKNSFTIHGGSQILEAEVVPIGLLDATTSVMIIAKEQINHTSKNCWIKHGLPVGYKNNFKNNFGSSKPFASVAESETSIVTNFSTVESDKPSAQFGFSKKQYQAILALLPQSQKASLPVTTVHQCTTNSSSSVPSSSSWILDSGATDHICPFQSAFKTLKPISPISI